MHPILFAFLTVIGILSVCALVVGIIMLITSLTGSTIGFKSTTDTIDLSKSPGVHTMDVNPYSDKLFFVTPKTRPESSYTPPPKDLGYLNTDKESGGFERGYYNLSEGDDAVNYCRYVENSPKPMLSCSLEPSDNYYSLEGIDQGYVNTRGIFKLPGSKEQAFCRGVGLDADPVMACVPVVSKMEPQGEATVRKRSFNKDNQYYLMGKVGTASNYFQKDKSGVTSVVNRKQ